MIAAFFAADASGQAKGELDRTVLPIAEPKRPTYKELDARKAKPPARFEVKAPKGAPNVVIVLIDDIGFGGPSTFGGPIRTPTMDQLAQSGLRFNNFHTTALCSPTRVALKSGRNHHTANAGSIMETATAFPGNTGQIPNSVAPLAEMLRLNGYSTGAFGKWHETAAWETSVSGPFDRWPTHQGFDKFYGFIGGETDQWYPLIYDGVIKVDPPKMKDYHFSVDMTNQAINWVKAQQSMTPDKPFFVYYATGAVHAPHHVPKEWADKYKGQFDKGWDQIRNETLERQKKLGVIPANTRLGDRPKDIVAWDSLPADQRRLFARQAEVFAGFLEHTDNEVGRLKKALEDIDELDNTLFIYISGDNGTSAEGGFVGMYNEMTYFNGVVEKVEDLIPLIDKWGGPETFPHMSAGWAVAFDTPFTWTKQVASDFGGTRNGTVIHWPKSIKEKGGLRGQFSHVIDIAPTILEAARLPQPKSVNGVVQTPIEGTSLVYAFNNAKAPERHKTQYFEMFGNRGPARRRPRGAADARLLHEPGRRQVGLRRLHDALLDELRPGGRLPRARPRGVGFSIFGAADFLDIHAYPDAAPWDASAGLGDDRRAQPVQAALRGSASSARSRASTAATSSGPPTACATPRAPRASWAPRAGCSGPGTRTRTSPASRCSSTSTRCGARSTVSSRRSCAPIPAVRGSRRRSRRSSARRARGRPRRGGGRRGRVAVVDRRHGDRRQDRAALLGDPQPLPARTGRRRRAESASNCAARPGSSVPLIASSGISRTPRGPCGASAAGRRRREPGAHGAARRSRVRATRRRARAARSNARWASIWVEPVGAWGVLGSGGGGGAEDELGGEEDGVVARRRRAGVGPPRRPSRRAAGGRS